MGWEWERSQYFYNIKQSWHNVGVAFCCYIIMKIKRKEHYMQKIFICAVLMVFILTMSGCATITCGPNQRVPVSTNPPGATVSVDGTGSHKTPTTLKLRRKTDHNLIFTKEGYETEHVLLMHVISGAVAGNILLGGLIGWGVDAMTGAQWKLVPESVHVEMKRLTNATATSASRAVKKDATLEDKLVQLQSLYDKKLITETEYEATKKIILHEISGGTRPAAKSIPEPAEVATEAAETVHEEIETLTEPKE